MTLDSSSFGRTTLALLGGALVMVVVIVSTSLWFSYQTEEHNEVIKIERDILIAADGVLNALVSAETGKRGYLLTGDREFLAPFEQARPNLEENFSLLRQRTLDRPALGALAAEIERLALTKMAELQEVVDLKVAGNDQAALDIVKAKRGERLMESIRDRLTDIIDRAHNNGLNAQAALDASRFQLRVLILLGGAVMIAFAGAAFYVVAKNTQALVAARAEVEEFNLGLEERVAERTLELSRANDEIQRFAYIVSHDLRAPLVNIMGFTSELEAGANVLREYFTAPVPSEEAQEAARLAAIEDLPEAVQFIRSSTGRMDGLIAAILKLSREGRRELQPERLDMGDLLTRATQSIQHQIEEKEADVEIDENLPSVVSDRLALEQVFGNLLDNAVKYLAKGRPGLIKVTGEQSGGRVKITVSDNGRGIAEKDQERVFELFRRAGVQDTKGEGVGLAHVRALIRRLGGDVTITSQLGEGTSFTVDLPKKAKFQDKGARL